MYWTLELASYLDDAPWPASKDELIDYGIRSGAPLEVVENLQELLFVEIVPQQLLLLLNCSNHVAIVCNLRKQLLVHYTLERQFPIFFVLL